MQDHPVSSYSQIDEHVFLGSNFCCQEHFDKDLLAKGVTTEISLQREHVDAPFGVKAFLWLPVLDGHAPTEYQLRLGIQALDAAVRHRQKVYVHCRNGHGRGPTMVIAYYISKGKSFKEARDFVSSKRPEVHLGEDQVEALKDFAESYNM
jgi:protein-tyrosine phosphatase